jgi:nickel/cobalt exporter
MTLVDLLRPDAGGPAFLAAAALLLGALHALEPGHSKAMMAAFVIAVRGTARQAVLLGLSAAASHSAIVWLLALLGLTFKDSLIAQAQAPYVSIAIGGIILATGSWTIARAWRARHGHRHHHHDHGHDHHHHHHHHHQHDELDEDAHAQAHAAELRDFFQGGSASNRQVVLFGLTGGLIPCSAAVTVLLLCLQQDRILLGMGLVSAFTLGLAAVLVAVGLIAALGLQLGTAGGSRRIDLLLRQAPLASGAVLAVLGVVMINGAFAELGI